ncbi:hypothetical protein PIB30_068526 [Stylosanthes scabra]|uniref:Uncharacterized protein n=1 Tax=Stylosanthes scabra TaxID=79078 RepID=A0ABU6UNI5_9FABA|nr:hypothetical protein [Stylosanthes scabra]
MDLKKVKGINWMGNIYNKFEAVCNGVDDIVGQDAVKYLENRFQNVGDSVKRFYSDVVQDLLPLPALVNEKYEAKPLPLENNISCSVKEVVDDKDDDDDNNNKNKNIYNIGNEEKPINNFMESLQESIDNDEDNQALASTECGPVYGVNFENNSDFPEVEESNLTEEVDDDDDQCGENFGAEKENLHTITEILTVDAVPQQMNLISFKQEEPCPFSICIESCSGSTNSRCEVSFGQKDKLDVNVELARSTCSVAEKSTTDSFASQVLNFKSLGEKEFPEEASLCNELTDVVNLDTCRVQTEVCSTASAMLGEKPSIETEPICAISSLVFESCSMVWICREPSPSVAGLIQESQDRLVSFSHSQTTEPKDKSLVNDMESSLEDIQLNIDIKLGESCVFVDDIELYAVSSRMQKLRSYKKKIQDAFASKKRLAKEYEQLAIWYGDTDMEPSPGLSQNLLPFGSRTYVSSQNSQAQHACESDWELL